MTLPFAPPTDNIWKLLAIGGFVLVVVGVVVPYERDAEQLQARATLSGATEDLNARVNTVAKNVAQLNAWVDEAATQPATANSTELLKSMRQQMSEMRATAYRNDDAVAELRGKMATGRVLSVAAQDQAWKFQMMIAVGVLMMCIGFFFWLPLQWHQDKLLRLQVQKAEQELKAAKVG